MTATDFAALIARAKAGTGPDLELDARIDAQLGDQAVQRIPPLTWSLDAVEAFRQRVLPGWKIEAKEFVTRDGFMVMLFKQHDAASPIFESADTEPRARLAATLSALVARQPSPLLSEKEG